MSYLQLKKRAFMKVVNSVKGIVRTASGIPPLMLEDCVDNDSMIGYTIHGNTALVGGGDDLFFEDFQSVGDYDEASGKYKIPIICRGKNLLPFPYEFKSKTTSGITITVNEDGSILLNGTSTAGASHYLFNNKTELLPNVNIGDTITVSKNCNDESQQGNVYVVANYYDINGSMQQGALASTTISGYRTVTDNWIGIGAYVHIPKDRTLNNLLIRPMIEKGSAATEYEPYAEPVTTNIYLDEPLGSGETVSYPDAPKLPTVKGTTIYEVDTTARPSQIDVTYYSTEEGD